MRLVSFNRPTPNLAVLLAGRVCGSWFPPILTKRRADQTENTESLPREFSVLMRQTIYGQSCGR
jgi:hypothetical protein